MPAVDGIQASRQTLATVADLPRIVVVTTFENDDYVYDALHAGTGLSSAEVAGELFVSVQTVKTHVGNILAEFAARDRTQAVIAAYESGFITPG
jgi:DNA-binding NarL/FixJ family response regulator